MSEEADLARRLDEAAAYMRQGHAVIVPDLLALAAIQLRANAETLRGLSDGSLVVVPAEPTPELFLRVTAPLSKNDLRGYEQWASDYLAILAAAQEPQR